MTDGGDSSPRRGREGSRWYGEPPSPEDFAAWFATVKLHDGMRHEDFIGGISLIQTSEESKRVIGTRGDGTALTADAEEIVFTPYPRADARVLYFWTYLGLHPEWVGSIEPGRIVVDPASPESPAALPEGFFRLSVERTGGLRVALVGRIMRARICGLAAGEDIFGFPSEVKTVPMLTPHGAVDVDAFAKASTGAIGRALGAAGMLVLPGSGVATAEDIRELTAGGPTEAPALPSPTAISSTPSVRDPQPQQVLIDLMQRLQLSDKAEEINAWWAQRGFPAILKLTHDQLEAALIQCHRLAQDATPVVQVADGA